MEKRADGKTVVLVTGVDRRELVRQALGMLGDAFQERIASAKRIFIHPNLVTHFRKAACTDAEAVRGVVDHISLLRGDAVLVGDAAFHGTKHAFQKLGYETLGRSGNVKLIDLNDDETIESYAYAADFKKRPIGFSKIVAESDFNIVVVPAKMHSYGIVTLAVKTHVVGSQVVKASPFGIHGRWPWNHTGYKPYHLTLADVYAEHPAQLAIIDATQAMEGNGPAAGREVNLGWLVASLNPVAADALAAYLMGFDPRDIGYLYHLDQKGLGPIQPSVMHIIVPELAVPAEAFGEGRVEGRTLDKIEGLRRDLAKPDTYPEILNWR